MVGEVGRGTCDEREREGERAGRRARGRGGGKGMECANAHNVDSCEYDCVHGTCNPATKQCDCEPNYYTKDCSVCM